MMKRVFLFQNIVGAESIVCTQWQNIVGAAAPTAPMVPMPVMLCVMAEVDFRSNYFYHYSSYSISVL